MTSYKKKTFTKKKMLKLIVNVTETNKERNVKIKCECDRN